MNANRICIAAICILVLFWLQAEWRAWQLWSEIDRVYAHEVTISTVDADTGKPLPIILQSPPATMGQRWPKEFYMTTTSELSTMRIRWISSEPVEVGVSAEGFTWERLVLDRDSEDDIVVKLRR